MKKIKNKLELNAGQGIRERVIYERLFFGQNISGQRVRPVNHAGGIMTKFTFRFLLVLALCLFGSGYALAAPVAYVHSLTGTMQVQYGTGAPQELKLGSTIDSGAILSTGPGGTAVVKFEDGQIMAMLPNTRFAVRQYEFVTTNVAKSSAVFELLRGGLRFVTGMIGETNKNAFKLTAGTATIGIRGSDGTVVIDPVTAAITAAVQAGALSLSNNAGTTVVTAGDFSTAAPNTPPTAAQNIAALAVSAMIQSLNAAKNIVLPPNTVAVIAAMSNAVVKQAAANAAAAALAANPNNTALQTANTQAQGAAADALNSAIQSNSALGDNAIKGGGATGGATGGSTGGATGGATGGSTGGASGGGGGASIQ